MNEKKKAEPVAWESALEFAAQTIELYDDATMRNDYMLDASECAAIIRALKTMYPTQPVQPVEPVAFYGLGSQLYGMDGRPVKFPLGTQFYTHPAPAVAQGEPVGEIQIEDIGKPFNAMRVRVHFYKEVPPVGAKIYTAPPAVAVNEQLLEALKELMYARTDKAEGMADAAIAAAQKELDK